eukprot:3973714-Amphidinium_carterae.1
MARRRWLVSFHADLAQAKRPYITSFVFFNLNVAKQKMQAQPTNIMTKFLPCPFETRNMSAGCSAVVIQAGSCLGLAK